MSVYEALMLMFAFATLVLCIINIDNKIDKK
ncbi:putative holin-like toxin [Atopostipes suicloacalis]